MRGSHHARTVLLMTNTELLRASHNWRDHDDCPRGIATVVVIDGTEHDATRCPCGGWYYTPDLSEVYDF